MRSISGGGPIPELEHEVIIMTIRLHNTLTRQKEDFTPLDASKVRMYVCGPTVYDYAHIGNARPVIVFDVLYRLLRHTYGENHVTYVRNITDIDDKINARAAEVAAAKNISVEEARVEITTRTTKQYFDDVTALGCLMPAHNPRATDYVAGMVTMIATLIEAGHAYEAEGHVLYDVSSKPDYGKLSRRSLDEMMAGARVEVAPYKKNPMDFVLWKPSDDLTPGWDSPWGRGRPGWHIECSVMGGALLGDSFDIHGGGVDLMFPHHENEIAQSEGAHHNHQLAQIWMHNGFLQVEGEKMSKSLGNFITINELLKDWPGEVLRFNMLRTHYRQPIDWTVKGLEDSRASLDRLKSVGGTLPVTAYYDTVSERVLNALCDDLNTPLAITHIFELCDEAEKNAAAVPVLWGTLAFLGLVPTHLALQLDAKRMLENWNRNFSAALKPPFDEIENAFKWATGTQRALASFSEALRKQESRFKETLSGIVEGMRFASPRVTVGEMIDIEDAIGISSLNAQIELRLAARKAKDFHESDRIRDVLLSNGIVLKDGPTGTTWEVKR